MSEKKDEIVDLEDGTGLGDKVEKAIPSAVKKVVKKVAGDDCGCKERKEWLNNQHFNFFNTKKGCMTKEQLTKWEEFKKGNHKTLNQEQQTFVIEMYNSVLATNIKGCGNCSGAAWKGYIQRIDLVYNKIKEDSKPKKTRNVRTKK